MRAAWLAPLLATIALVAACDSSSTLGGAGSGASATPTEPPATATPTGAPATTSTATATPTGTPIAALHTLEGVFESGFEHSAFYPESRCSSDGMRFWLSWTAESRFDERIREETGQAALAESEVIAFRVVVRAELSTPGEYGHLGAYLREVTVHELLDATPADGCDTVASDAGATSVPRRVALLTEFGMLVGDVVLIGETSETLRFVGVAQDSRCATDVTCVWAGEALLAFELRRGGTIETIAVPVSPTAGTAALGPLLIRAAELTPAPRSTEPIAQARYEATVVLEPLPPPAAESGVHGVVTLGPFCPVQRADQSCPDRPFAATLLLLDADGREVGRTTSGDDGAYRLPAPGGSYTLAPQPIDGHPLPAASSALVSIRSGHWTTLNVPFDSGIR